MIEAIIKAIIKALFGSFTQMKDDNEYDELKKEKIIRDYEEEKDKIHIINHKNDMIERKKGVDEELSKIDETSLTDDEIMNRINKYV